MRRPPVNRLAALALGLLVAACGAPGAKRSDSEDAAEAPKPVVVRPVVVAAQGSEEMVKAVGFLMVKNYPQAEANLEEIVRVRPDIAEAHFNLAWVRQQLGAHTRVVDAVLPGLALRPNEIRAWLLLALSERELGRFADAEASYHAGLALAPNDPRLHLNAGILYDLYLQKPAEALEHYRRYQALQAVPDAKVAGWIAVLDRQVARAAEDKAAAEAAVQPAAAPQVEPAREPPVVAPPKPAKSPEPVRKRKGGKP